MTARNIATRDCVNSSRSPCTSVHGAVIAGSSNPPSTSRALAMLHSSMGMSSATLFGLGSTNWGASAGDGDATSIATPPGHPPHLAHLTHPPHLAHLTHPRHLAHLTHLSH